MDEWDKIEYLKQLRLIGPFPNGLLVLLVPVQTALDELCLIDKSYTKANLLTLLKERNIFIFNTVEDYVKFKTPEKKR